MLSGPCRQACGTVPPVVFVMQTSLLCESMACMETDGVRETEREGERDGEWEIATTTVTTSSAKMLLLLVITDSK